MGTFTKGVSLSKPDLERLGAKVRAWQTDFAGANVGGASLTMRYDSYAALAAASKKSAQDAQVAKHAERTARSEVTTLVGTFLLRELPGLEPSSPPATAGPRVRTLALWAVERGRMQDALALLAEAKQHSERLGANSGASSVVSGGAASGQIVTVTEFADIAAFGAYQEKVLADDAFQAFVATRFGSGSPLTRLSSTMGTELAA